MNRPLLKAFALSAFALFLAIGPVRGQDRDAMGAYQRQITSLFSTVFSAPTDNQRYNANEQVVQLFTEALAIENSFYYKWNFDNNISLLTSSDKKFRICTWAVVRDDGEYECFGWVQAYNEKTETFDTYVLNDKSDEMINIQESVLSPDNWYGAVYQQLVETKYDGREYYTLIGWSGCNNLTQRKVIEPILFRTGSSKPQFGQALFRKEKNLRRVVFEYSKNAMVNVVYDDQFYTTVENRKVKGKKGRVYNVQEKHNTKEKMIMFDEIAPMVEGMEGLFQYYVPTGTEMAYAFVNGKWELRESAEGRVAGEKLNKEFAPLPKSDPAYKVQLRRESTPEEK